MRFFVLENFSISKNNISYAQAAKVLWLLLCTFDMFAENSLKTVASSLDVNVTTPSSPNKDEAVRCMPSISFLMQPSFIIPPEFNVLSRRRVLNAGRVHL
jgi:hypothetical protein